MNINYLIPVLAVVAGVLGLYVGNHLHSPEQIDPFERKATHYNQQAPAVLDIALPLLDDTPARLSDWKGNILVVNFWATWCPPCRKEIPTFVQLQKKWQAHHVQFIGIALDDKDKVLRFAKEHAINYPNMLGVLDNIDMSVHMGNSASVMPYTVIIDQNFNLVASHAGEMTEKMLHDVIQPLWSL